MSTFFHTFSIDLIGPQWLPFLPHLHLLVLLPLYLLTVLSCIIFFIISLVFLLLSIFSYSSFFSCFSSLLSFSLMHRDTSPSLFSSLFPSFIHIYLFLLFLCCLPPLFRSRQSPSPPSPPPPITSPPLPADFDMLLRRKEKMQVIPEFPEKVSLPLYCR